MSAEPGTSQQNSSELLADRAYAALRDRIVALRIAPGAPINEDALGHIRRLNEIAQTRGQSLAQMALAWALRDQRVTSVLVGASSVRQLEQNVHALDELSFNNDELWAIDEHAVDAGVDLWEAPRTA